MAKSRFSQDQITAVVLEMNVARRPNEIARKYGISTTTLYRWRVKVADRRKASGDRLYSLESENRRLKNRIAELSLDYTSLRVALLKDVKREC